MARVSEPTTPPPEPTIDDMLDLYVDVCGEQARQSVLIWPFKNKHEARTVAAVRTTMELMFAAFGHTEKAAEAVRRRVEEDSRKNLLYVNPPGMSISRIMKGRIK